MSWPTGATAPPPLPCRARSPRRRAARANITIPGSFAQRASTRASAWRHAAKLDNIVFDRERAEPLFVRKFLLGQGGQLLEKQVKARRLEDHQQLASPAFREDD